MRGKIDFYFLMTLRNYEYYEAFWNYSLDTDLANTSTMIMISLGRL